MKKQIKIRIYPNGKIESVTKNIKGKACLEYLKPLEKLLEARVIDSEFTSEFYEQEEYEQTNDQIQAIITE